MIPRRERKRAPDTGDPRLSLGWRWMEVLLSQNSAPAQPRTLRRRGLLGISAETLPVESNDIPDSVMAVSHGEFHRFTCIECTSHICNCRMSYSRVYSGESAMRRATPRNASGYKIIAHVASRIPGEIESEGKELCGTFLMRKP